MKVWKYPFFIVLHATILGPNEPDPQPKLIKFEHYKGNKLNGDSEKT